MWKLRKYVYKFWAPILLCIGCVFIQSQTELTLPGYMSEIVTNGIQSGGFKSSVSEVLSEETRNALLGILFFLIAFSFMFINSERYIAECSPNNSAS